MPNLEITEVVLMHCKVVNNSYQQNSSVLYAFVPNKSLDQLLYISPKNYIFKNVWFTNQNSKPLEIEDKINITLVIN